MVRNNSFMILTSLWSEKWGISINLLYGNLCKIWKSGRKMALKLSKISFIM